MTKLTTRILSLKYKNIDTGFHLTMGTIREPPKAAQKKKVSNCLNPYPHIFCTL